MRTGQPQALPHTTAGFLFYSAVLSVTTVTPGAHPKRGAGLHPLQIGMFKKTDFCRHDLSSSSVIYPSA